MFIYLYVFVFELGTFRGYESKDFGLDFLDDS